MFFLLIRPPIFESPLLASKAWDRVKSNDATIGERMAATAVFGAMKTKRGLSKIGGRINRKNKIKTKSKKKLTSFNQFCNCIRNKMIQNRPKDFSAAVNVAVKAARYIKNGNNKVGKVPRIIPVPKIGGILPLIPIFAGLSAIGSLIGSTAGIMKAVNSASEGRKQLAESERHNHTMESIILGKNIKGDGLYMRPYRTGYGLYMRPFRNGKGISLNSMQKN